MVNFAVGRWTCWSVSAFIFTFGVGFWMFEAATRRSGTDGRYLADMAESVRLGREIERRLQGPPELV